MSLQNEEDTICHKVNQLIKGLEHAAKTGQAPLGEWAKQLHKIRQSAQKMEDGLRHRKKIMVDANIEDDYQKYKKVMTKPGTNGINLIANTDEIRTDKSKFEFIAKQDGKVVYHHNGASAGVISIAERIDDIDEMGAIIGVTQKFIFGTPLAKWFAFNQLEHYMEDGKLEILTAAEEMMRLHKDPVLKKRLLDKLNNKL